MVVVLVFFDLLLNSLFHIFNDIDFMFGCLYQFMKNVHSQGNYYLSIKKKYNFIITHKTPISF